MLFVIFQGWPRVTVECSGRHWFSACACRLRRFLNLFGSNSKKLNPELDCTSRACPSTIVLPSHGFWYYQKLKTITPQHAPNTHSFGLRTDTLCQFFCVRYDARSQVSTVSYSTWWYVQKHPRSERLH